MTLNEIDTFLRALTAFPEIKQTTPARLKKEKALYESDTQKSDVIVQNDTQNHADEEINGAVAESHDNEAASPSEIAGKFSAGSYDS